MSHNELWHKHDVKAINSYLCLEKGALKIKVYTFDNCTNPWK